MWKALVFAALCAVMAAACGDSDDAPPTPPPTVAVREEIVVAPGEPLVVGVSAALSGDQKDLGMDLVAATFLAIGQFGNTVKGHPIQLSSQDDGCSDPLRAVDVAEGFGAEPALAGVVGPMCTNGALAANPHYEHDRIVHISPSSTRVELSELGERYFFRTSWRDDAQAAVQASYARDELNAATAFVIADGEPYGNALAAGFAASFEASGGRVLAELRLPRGTSDVAPVVRQVLDARPDVVVFQGFNPEGALLLKGLAEVRYAGRFIGPDALLSIRDFIGTAGTAADGAILTGGATPSAEFVATYVALYQRPPTTSFVLQTHDAVTALLRAIDTASTLDDDGTLRVNREQLAATLRDQRLGGLTGSVAFDDRGDRRGETPAELGVTVYRVESGVFVAVE